MHRIAFNIAAVTLLAGCAVSNTSYPLPPAATEYRTPSGPNL
jgi:hypothetical protein